MMVLSIIALILAAIPALLFLVNLRLYRTAPQPTTSRSVSVLIPARNEERAISAAIETAMANRGVDLEVIVLDDHSEDRTVEIVRSFAAYDQRVRLEQAPQLPQGWCGKQHACHVLASLARHDLLVFVDADVRLQPDGLARMIAFLDASEADLVSGVPYQETETFLEWLLIPLIHFVLLGFLPINRMRKSVHPSYASGCGQLFLARRGAYMKAGGHAAIRTSLHDGITLPRAFRIAGCKTDLFDATDVATCRMYRSAIEVWRGLAKNAVEGLGNPRVIVPFTVMLLGGQVLPYVLLPWMALSNEPVFLPLMAMGLAYLPRWCAVFRFRQSWLGAILHPFGVLVLLAIQWYALGRALLGRPAAWRGRQYVDASRSP